MEGNDYIISFTWRGTGRKHEELQSALSMSRPRFEPFTFPVKRYTVA
jgi:hypothetical protein